MSIHDKPDNIIDGQMSLDQVIQAPARLVAVSKIFARARKEMSLAEQKTFVYALSQLRFKDPASSCVVRLDKKTLADIVGIHSDPDHLSVDLYEQIKDLPTHSFLTIRERDLGLYASGTFVNTVLMFKNIVRIRLNEDYMPLFTNLTTEYITLWSSDIFAMTSKRSVQFYEYLRQITDTRKKLNSVLLGVRALKDLLEIPKEGPGSYMRGDINHFDRANFEKKVIDPICEDLAKSRMITLTLQADGKYYEKVKKGNRVDGYRFSWTYTAHPAVATAAEVSEIQEAVDKDPEILKVAKDIVSGKKKAGKGKTGFHNFQERKTDYNALVEDYLERQQDPPLAGQYSFDLDGNISQEP